jgi:hypothetical protein
MYSQSPRAKNVSSGLAFRSYWGGMARSHHNLSPVLSMPRKNHAGSPSPLSSTTTTIFFCIIRSFRHCGDFRHRITQGLFFRNIGSLKIILNRQSLYRKERAMCTTDRSLSLMDLITTFRLWALLIEPTSSRSICGYLPNASDLADMLARTASRYHLLWP